MTRVNIKVSRNTKMQLYSEDTGVFCLLCRALSILTCAVYGARHDLRWEILGACKASDTPLRSLSYHSVDCSDVV